MIYERMGKGETLTLAF